MQLEHVHEEILHPSTGSLPTIFACEQLNLSTFLIVENDRFEEHPFIYIKILRSPPLIIVGDTGCGGGPHSSGDTLRNFLETHPIAANGHRPLNPRMSNGEPSLPYFIICTHCHYDHILGIPGFRHASPVILAASSGKSFLESDLPRHSLCYYMNVPTPQYAVSYWADDMARVAWKGVSLGVQVLHTPGHTPDELAWYDEAEAHLFVGDSFYERVATDKSYTQAIVFPEHGDIIEYMHSLAKMIEFVKRKNAEHGRSIVKIGCGHITSSVDAQDILDSVQQWFRNIIDDRIPIKETLQRRGEICDLWHEDGDPRFSLLAPRRLMDEAREHWGRKRPIAAISAVT